MRCPCAAMKTVVVLAMLLALTSVDARRLLDSPESLESLDSVEALTGDDHQASGCMEPCISPDNDSYAGYCGGTDP